MKKLLLTYLLLIGTLISAQITLGSGTTSGGVSTSVATVPWSTYYGYSYTQQILTKADINANAAGNITGLKFYLSASSVLTNSNEVVVYVGLTNKATFSSTTDWIPTTSLTQVFSGTATNNAGVVEITFSAPFAYDNVNNLVIAVDENKSGDDGGEHFYAYSNGANKTLYYRSDSTNPDPVSITQTGTRSATQSVVTLLGLTPSPVPNCPSVTLPAAAATGVSITPTITWGAVGNATGYKLSVGTTAGGTDIINSQDLGNVTTFVLPTALEYNKQYFYTVTAYNGIIPSVNCVERSFTTLNIPCPAVATPAANATNVPVSPSITWAAVSGATGYKIKVGTTTGGTDIVNNVDLGNVLTYSFGTPLNLSTKYYYTVTSYNATTTSASCTERSFTTTCGVLSAPYSEAFSGGVLPNCWASQNPTSTSTDANVKWKFTGNADYGANLANNGRASGTYAWVDASTPYAGIHTVELLSPSINLTGLNAPYVSFEWFKNHSTSTSTTVGVSTYDNNQLTVDINSGAGWVTIFTGTSNAQIWRTEGVALSSSYIGATVQLRFTVDKNVGTNPYFYDDILLDNVEIKEAPSCIVPNTLAFTNLTPTGANVTWVAPTPAPALGYDVYYSSTNTAPTGTSTPQYIGVNATMQNIPGTSGTVFYVWVRSRCSATSQSSWVGPVSYTIPFAPPANDVCSGAIALIPGATFAQNALTGTTVGGTTDGTTTCQSFRGNNVWYSVVVPASGSLTVETNVVTGSPLTDTVLSVHGGTCGGTFTDINCDDDAGEGNFSKVVLTGQTPGATLFVSVWRYTNNTSNLDGQFMVSAYDASLSASEVSQVKNNLKVYPNPFADVLNISDVKNVKSVSVIDIAGRLVKTIEKPGSALQLGELKSGMYVVVLNMNDGSKQTIKAIKK